jgi:cysteinyl-tRNA synthetase
MKKLLIGIIVITILSSSKCEKDEYDGIPQMNYKEAMRQFVIGISEYSKHIYSDFIIIPQNGIELMSNIGEINGAISTVYSNAIDGN